MRSFLQKLLPQRIKTNPKLTADQKIAEAKSLLGDAKKLAGEAINKQVANISNAEKIQANTAALNRSAGRFKNISATANTGSIPEYKPPLFKNLTDEQIQDLALNYRQKKLLPSEPNPIGWSLQNTAKTNPYDDIAQITSKGIIDEKALKTAEIRLKELTGKDVFLSPNKKAILNEFKGNSKLSGKLKNIVGQRDYVLPQDLQKLQEVFPSFNVQDYPNILNEMELLGSRDFTTPFRDIQHAAGGKYNMSRQFVDATPQPVQKAVNALWQPVRDAQNTAGNFVKQAAAENPEMAQQIIAQNQNTLLDVLNSRLDGKPLPKADTNQILDSWLTNPKEFEAAPSILPYREYALERPVLNEILKDSTLSKQAQQHLGDVLVDMSKERVSPNINSLLQHAQENPAYVRSRLKQMYPESANEIFSMHPNARKSMFDRIAENANKLPQEKAAFWKQLAPEDMAYLDEDFMAAYGGNNTAVQQQLQHLPLSQAQKELPKALAPNNPVDDLLSQISGSSGDFKSANSGAESFYTANSASPMADLNNIDELADAATFNRFNKMPIAPRSNSGLTEEALAQFNAAREAPAAVAQAPAQASKFGSIMKGAGKVANAAMLIDALKQGAALKRNWSENIKEHGLVEGGWKGAKETFSGVANYGLDSAKGMADLVFGGKYYNPTTGQMEDNTSRAWWKDYLPDNPLDKQRFQSNGTLDDLKNYFKEFANDVSYSAPINYGRTDTNIFAEDGKQGYTQNNAANLFPLSPVSGTVAPVTAPLQQRQDAAVQTDGAAALGVPNKLPQQQIASMGQQGVERDTKAFKLFASNARGSTSTSKFLF